MWKGTPEIEEVDLAKGAQNWKEDETICTQKFLGKVINSTKACTRFDIQDRACSFDFFFLN